MTTPNDLLKAIKDDGIDFVDLRFTDFKGKLQHVTLEPPSQVFAKQLARELNVFTEIFLEH